MQVLDIIHEYYEKYEAAQRVLNGYVDDIDQAIKIAQDWITYSQKEVEFK